MTLSIELIEIIQRVTFQIVLTSGMCWHAIISKRQVQMNLIEPDSCKLDFSLFRQVLG